MLADAAARLLPHEWALGALYGALVAALVARGAATEAAWWASLAAGHAAAVLVCRRAPGAWSWRVRLGYGFVVMNAGYALAGPAVAALGIPGRDAALLAADRALFGDTLALHVARALPAALAEPLAACYAMLFPYVALSGFRHLRRAASDLPTAQRFFAGLLVVYAAGFAGYVLVPAHGPYFELAGSFGHAAGPVARLNDSLERHATNGVDAFPSLHVAASAYTLLFDRAHAPRRFLLWAAPVAGLWVSTLYFGFHYGVDVLAGAAVAAAGLTVAARTRAVPLVPGERGAARTPLTRIAA